jgi:hypothetical protein
MLLEWMNDRRNDGKNELSPNYMYACPQLDTSHVGRYFGPLAPTLELRIK